MKLRSKLLGLLLGGAVSVLAPISGSRAAEESPRVDPQGIGHLKRMGASLAAARALTFKSTRTVEVASNAGQFLTFFYHGAYGVGVAGWHGGSGSWHTAGGRPGSWRR